VLPGRARLNAALFYVVTENEIVVDQNSGGRATFKNVGHTDRRGLELGAETLLGGRFEARAAYTYLRAVFREGFDTVLGTTSVVVPSGAQLPGTSRHQLFGELRYKQAPLFAALEALCRSRVAVNDPNSEYADAFTVFNAVAGLTQQASGWRLTEYVRVDNIADRTYAGSVIVNETNARYYEPAPRRSMSVGVQAALTF
jgi:iron complex outermembrane recepter protein